MVSHTVEIQSFVSSGVHLKPIQAPWDITFLDTSINTAPYGLAWSKEQLQHPRQRIGFRRADPGHGSGF